jgi:hypothetical protein
MASFKNLFSNRFQSLFSDFRLSERLVIISGVISAADIFIMTRPVARLVHTQRYSHADRSGEKGQRFCAVFFSAFKMANRSGLVLGVGISLVGRFTVANQTILTIFILRELTRYVQTVARLSTSFPSLTANLAPLPMWYMSWYTIFTLLLQFSDLDD